MEAHQRLEADVDGQEDAEMSRLEGGSPPCPDLHTPAGAGEWWVPDGEGAVHVTAVPEGEEGDEAQEEESSQEASPNGEQGRPTPSPSPLPFPPFFA